MENLFFGPPLETGVNSPLTSFLKRVKYTTMCPRAQRSRCRHMMGMVVGCSSKNSASSQ